MKKNANHWVHEMLGATKAEKIPAGWVTVDAMAKQAGLPARTATNRAMALIHEGKLQRRQFRVKIAGRGVVPVWHYGPVKKQGTNV